MNQRRGSKENVVAALDDIRTETLSSTLRQKLQETAMVGGSIEVPEIPRIMNQANDARIMLLELQNFKKPRDLRPK